VSRRSQRKHTHTRPRKKLNLGVETATAYLIQFEIKTPLEVTDAPPYVRRESPPTLNEDEARAAYRDLLLRDSQTPLGIRNVRLVERVVTDTVIADHKAEAAQAEDAEAG
jgi:hypothetical protein